MVDEAKSVDIKLYSVSKVEAAFEAAEVADEQPVADVVAAMRDRILEHLNAGRSISWVISVLQRGGIDLGSRQLRTYLQRAGIGVSSKRTAKGNVSGTRRSARKPKATDADAQAQAQEGAVQASPVEDGNHADEAREVKVKTSCSERAATHAQDVQSAGSGFGNVSAWDVQSAAAENMQDAGQNGGGQTAAGMNDAPATDVQAVSDDSGGAPAETMPRARKAGRRSSGTDAEGAPTDGVHPSVASFGQASDDNDDDLL